ncbi:hypothetical protein SUGI_1046700 [Cryptomeria japonica]|nr:hypothetical protein SUGI_1046700 [Cryptomeria japonica]
MGFQCYSPDCGFALILCACIGGVWDPGGDRDANVFEVLEGVYAFWLSLELVGFSLPLECVLVGDPLLKERALVLQEVLTQDLCFRRPLVFVVGACLAFFVCVFGYPLEGCSCFFSEGVWTGCFVVPIFLKRINVVAMASIFLLFST